jgi:hypothetical protein
MVLSHLSHMCRWCVTASQLRRSQPAFIIVMVMKLVSVLSPNFSVLAAAFRLRSKAHPTWSPRSASDAILTVCTLWDFCLPVPPRLRPRVAGPQCARVGVRMVSGTVVFGAEATPLVIAVVRHTHTQTHTHTLTTTHTHTDTHSYTTTHTQIHTHTHTNTRIQN